MRTSHTSPLEEAIRHSGEAWLIDWFEPRDQAIPHLRQTLATIHQRANERLGGSAPDLSKEAIVAEYRRNPQKVRVFFQAWGKLAHRTVSMVWRLFQGMEIKEIRLEYERQRTFELQVILQSLYDGRTNLQFDENQRFCLVASDRDT